MATPLEPAPSDVDLLVSERWWDRWRRWRQTRPFWGGLLAVLAGVEIFLTEKAPLPVVLHVGPTGFIGYAVPIVMVLCGVLVWLAPQPRVLYSCLVILLSLASWITSNLGGFAVGMVIGLVGGALSLAWTAR